MNLIVLLDFDGVLFDSALEVYKICEKLTKGKKKFRQGIKYIEFLKYRPLVTDAWQYSLIYNQKKFDKNLKSFAGILPDTDDIAFSKKFFEIRTKISTNNYFDLIKPYNFFIKLRPLLLKYPDNFNILSTRNRNSIEKILIKHKIKKIKFFGQEDIKKYGSKISVFKKVINLKDDKFVIYIDDINEHLVPFKKEIDLTVQANWGYGNISKNSFDQEYCLKLISSFIKLNNN